MSQIKMEELLESGVHFGHQTNRWNPKMRVFIYGQKGGVHIFDLAKTVKHLDEALNFIKELSKAGKSVLFVGTKRQAQDIIRDEAQKCGSPYINQRWLGGILTNFSTIKKQIKKLNSLLEEQQNGAWNNLIKKERIIQEKELMRLKSNISGLQKLKDLPDALFVVDVTREYLAVAEAKKLGIPIIGICDTNANPDNISYVIPANDDAIKSIRFLVSRVAETIIKNKKAAEDKAIQKENKKDPGKEIKIKGDKNKAKNKPKEKKE